MHRRATPLENRSALTWRARGLAGATNYNGLVRHSISGKSSGFEVDRAMVCKRKRAKDLRTRHYHSRGGIDTEMPLFSPRRNRLILRAPPSFAL